MTNDSDLRDMRDSLCSGLFEQEVCLETGQHPAASESISPRDFIMQVGDGADKSDLTGQVLEPLFLRVRARIAFRMERATPILPTEDLKTAKSFYVDQLGFSVTFEVSEESREARSR